MLTKIFSRKPQVVQASPAELVTAGALFGLGCWTLGWTLGWELGKLFQDKPD